MDPAHIPDDAQRTLERHALRNVHALAERLGYKDGLERKAEKRGMKILAAVVVLVVVGLTGLTLLPSPGAADQARRRCEIDAQGREGSRIKNELVAARPDMTGVELQDELRMRVKQLEPAIKAECAAGSGGK